MCNLMLMNRVGFDRKFTRGETSILEIPRLVTATGDFKRNKMLNEIYQQEPNLIAEAYRNYTNSQIPRRVEKHFDFLEINEEGFLLLGTSNLNGRIWSGSVWVFENCPDKPDAENCTAGIEFESSVASGLWVGDTKNVVIGCDSGSLHILSLNKIENKKKNYFATECVTTEHDDSIISLDLMKSKMKLLSGSMDMSIRVWDAETLVCDKLYCPAHGHIVTSISSLPGTPDIFISTSLDGTSLLWDIRLEKPASLLIRNECGFTASEWLDDNCVGVGSNDGSVSLVDLRKKSEFDRNFAAKRPIFKIKYNSKLDYLAVCADDPFVRVFNCKEKTLVNIYESDHHIDFVRGLDWDPKDSNLLYSCGWDSKICSHQISAVDSNKRNEETKSVNEE